MKIWRDLPILMIYNVSADGRVYMNERPCAGCSEVADCIAKGKPCGTFLLYLKYSVAGVKINENKA
jgi:hypothetical protein